MFDPSVHFFEPLVTTAAMRAADAHAIETLGLPGRVLMESAGRGSVAVMARELGSPAGRRVLVVCGRGNNGGDGLVVARALHELGADVHAAVLGAEDDLTDDAAANLRLLQTIAASEDRLEISLPDSPAALNRFWPEWSVDALLGIGVSGELREPVATFAAWMNDCPAPIVALDVPTGLDSNTGAAAANSVRATLTITMGARKAGLVFGEGPAHAGGVHVVPFGVPAHRIAEAARQPGGAWLSTDRALAALLPARAADAHKYTAGRALVVAGSRQFPGAAAMTALAAARTGAGAVVVATPTAARDLIQPHLLEVMSAPLAETAAGTLAQSAFEALLERGASADAVAIGPGLGKDDETFALVRRLLQRLEQPLVIDADGLNALAGHTDLVRDHSGGRWVLTPHLGELRRLMADPGLQPEEPARLAASLARRLNCVLVLKGAPSVVGTPDGQALVAGPTTPALATAGTGDVLAGAITALLAQGLEPAAAAICALHATGRAAQRFAASRAPRSMMATDILGELPHVLPA